MNRFIEAQVHRRLQLKWRLLTTFSGLSFCFLFLYMFYLYFQICWSSHVFLCVCTNLIIVNKLTKGCLWLLAVLCFTSQVEKLIQCAVRPSSDGTNVRALNVCVWKQWQQLHHVLTLLVCFHELFNSTWGRITDMIDLKAPSDYIDQLVDQSLFSVFFWSFFYLFATLGRVILPFEVQILLL